MIKCRGRVEWTTRYQAQKMVESVVSCRVDHLDCTNDWLVGVFDTLFEMFALIGLRSVLLRMTLKPCSDDPIRYRD